MLSDKDFQLQPHPAITALREDYGRLTETLTQLIIQRDFLRRDILPTISAEYQLKIGYLEYQVFWAECELRALKRRIELAQASLNRSKKPSYQRIEKQINAEFSAWREQVEEKRREIKQAKEFSELPQLSAIDAKQFQSLYRKLAKRLHPDLNEPTERTAKLWQQTTEAYQAGDVFALETLWLIVENNQELIESSGSQTIEYWREKKAKLFKTIETVNSEIAEIRQTPPYTWQSVLSNESEVLRRQNELNERLAELRTCRLELTKHWAEVMQSAKDNDNIPDVPPEIFSKRNEDEFIS